MQMIDTPNGRVALFNDRDFVDVVREHVSDEAAAYLEEILNERMYLSEFYDKLINATLQSGEGGILCHN